MERTTEKAMTKIRVALIGYSDFFYKILRPLLRDSNMEVDIIEKDSLNCDTEVLDCYDLVMISTSIIELQDSNFFNLLFSAPGLILVDESPAQQDQQVTPTSVINISMSAEEIIARINDIIYSAPHTGKKPQRHSPRVKADIIVTYSYNNRHYLSKILNISVNGVYILALKPPPIGCRININFSLPDNGEAITATGRIVYSIGYNLEESIISHPHSEGRRIIAFPGMGVFFEKISPEDRKKLRLFICQHNV